MTKPTPPSQGPDSYNELQKSKQLIEGYKARLASMLRYIAKLEKQIEDSEDKI